MKIRISFEVPAGRSGKPRARQVLGYDLVELADAVRDWWHLRQAGRRPHVYVTRPR